MTQQITADEFEEKVLKADKPVLIDFFADWCGPCMAMAPVIDELGSDMQDSAYVYKMDVDSCSEITSALRIMSIPAFVVFKDGQASNMAVGAQHKDFLKSMLA